MLRAYIPHARRNFKGCLHEKTRMGASFVPWWLFDFVTRLHDGGSFHISVIWRYTSRWWNTHAIQNGRRDTYMHYPFQSTGRPISHRTGGRFAFTWYRCEISYWSEILARPSTTIGVNSRRGESHPNDILWWYHVKKCRAMRGNRSELAPARTSPRCHVNTPLSRIALLSTLWKPGTGQWRKWLAQPDLFRRNE